MYYGGVLKIVHALAQLPGLESRFCHLSAYYVPGSLNTAGNNMVQVAVFLGNYYTLGYLGQVSKRVSSPVRSTCLIELLQGSEILY